MKKHLSLYFFFCPMRRSKRQTSVLLKNIFSSYESAKLRGLRGLVDGVGRKFAWVRWVAWVYKILAWVKKMAWVALVRVFAWVVWVHEIVLLKRHYKKFRKIYRKTSLQESLVK